MDGKETDYFIALGAASPINSSEWLEECASASRRHAPFTTAIELTDVFGERSARRDAVVAPDILALRLQRVLHAHRSTLFDSSPGLPDVADGSSCLLRLHALAVIAVIATAIDVPIEANALNVRAVRAALQ